MVARQRPATAGGIVFLLLEDETGMVNCIVRPEVYERHRAVVRADPLVMAWGRLERRDRNLNVLVTRLERIEPPAEDAARPRTGRRPWRACAPPRPRASTSAGGADSLGPWPTSWPRRSSPR